MNVETAANTIASGATPVQIIILFFMGGIFLWCLVCLVRWLIRIKIKPFENFETDIKEIKAALQKNALTLNSMEGKLWSESKIRDEFEGTIEKHKNECPAWRFHCSEHGNIKD